VTGAPFPGAFAVVRTRGQLSGLIAVGEKLTDGFGQWTHAAVCTSVEPDGTAWIVEAEPDGARHVLFHYWDDPYLWSDSFPLTPPQQQAVAEAALSYVGTPYSFADYFAIAAHKFHIPAPNLREYIADSHHMICSQLADKCYQDAGIQLFNDGRWNGYVTPGDLGNLITEG
jgi:uncharacterized protein YycO